MRKKIKDLTLLEANKICETKGCCFAPFHICPLNFKQDGLNTCYKLIIENNISNKEDYVSIEFLEKEVEVDE